ncbi:hypothetical protein ABZ865_41260 [Streptomyces sp. NPDC047085]
MVRSAMHAAEDTWFATITARLPVEVKQRVLALVAEDADEAEQY